MPSTAYLMLRSARRARLEARTGVDAALAARCGTSEDAIARWMGREMTASYEAEWRARFGDPAPDGSRLRKNRIEKQI